MLPRINRLKRQEDFKAVRLSGRKAKAGRLLVNFLPQQVGSVSRGAVVISSKAVSGSVERNRIRRLMAKLMRQQFDNWATRSAGDMVVVLLGSADVSSSEELTADFNKCLEKLSLN
ncbi:ribonuclease P protein component [Candidatus Berkelbacteria bacterium RIFCSPLOWO2_01_FULL_50_28]|uniref:Ribonuclease P protein component n=1 Tax=Candidatus Berkelbacteria bacterium RIFCSPLOWO2_01_FULL_50_28 TaxID=1797471 RepID=A0A1F5EAX4_9BACT|nr:MAG: ribonuclease P protein component [Candidatus Berkelbacteria bacterium RIFCSPHIGHO2_01_FULL_50_36]OGD62335.1 MAG: ribonuclease P protein component [Candidatus Berkelbacteria bacterium RIFCSPHIGHO2_12_FULL_50_11]OGD64525.1 MAG: ribonuclease P protein component [Candidatus Berkelbacteria bacterium RIFCSPLOWO2_01_FULL_50_28]